MTSELRSGNVVNNLHVQMWKHYDDLRQKKNTTFLTANTILLAIAGFGPKEPRELVAAIAVLGIIIESAWFLLLTRNDAYIKFHRDLVGAEWRPATWTPRSSLLDRTLPVAFGAFWIFLLGQRIWEVARACFA